jgi:hypothetical protein
MSISFVSKTSTQITMSASYTGVATRADFSPSGSRTLDGTNTNHTFTYTITGLSPNTSYYVSVEWFNGSTSLGVNSYPSNPITTDPAPPPPAPSPVKMNPPSVKGYAPTTIVFSWGASSPVTSYSYSYRNLTTGQTISSSSTTGTSLTFSAPTAGTYQLGVTPFNGTTQGSGDQASVTVYDPPPPSDLTGLSGSAAGTGIEPATINFSWNASTPVTSYSWALRKDGTTIQSNTTTGRTLSFTGMMAGTYSLGVTPFNGATQGNGAISNDVVVNIDLTSTPAPTAPLVDTRIDSGFIMKWGSVTGASQYELQYKPNVNTVWQTTGIINGTTTTLTDLAYGLLYNFKVRALRAGVWSDFSSVNNATVNPKTPTLSGVFDGTSTITMTVSGMAGTTFSSVVVERRNATTDAFVDSKSTTVDGGQVTWTSGISPSTYKNYKYRAYSVSGGVNSLDYGTFSFDRPDNFYWTVYSGSDANGNKIQGSNLVVLASDWNNLIDRIALFRAYKGLPVATMTKVTPNVTVISAALYNQLANAINDMNPSGGTVPLVTGMAGSNPSNITAFAINRLNACLNTVL